MIMVTMSVLQAGNKRAVWCQNAGKQKAVKGALPAQAARAGMSTVVPPVPRSPPALRQ